MAQQKLTKKEFEGAFIVFGAIVFAMVLISDDPADDGMPTTVLNPGYVGCLTSSDLDAFVMAPERMQYSLITSNRCFLTSRLPEHDYSIVDYGSSTHVLVRLADDQYVDLYVPHEATMKIHAPKEIARVTE